MLWIRWCVLHVVNVIGSFVFATLATWGLWGLAGKVMNMTERSDFSNNRALMIAVASVVIIGLLVPAVALLTSFRLARVRIAEDWPFQPSESVPMLAGAVGFVFGSLKLSLNMPWPTGQYLSLLGGWITLSCILLIVWMVGYAVTSTALKSLLRTMYVFQ